jgi:hypothetical protein
MTFPFICQCGFNTTNPANARQHLFDKHLEEVIYPSFKAEHGRDAIPGQDYDPDATMCQDDYEYYTGTGPYSNELN